MTSLFLELLLAAILDGATKGRGEANSEQAILLTGIFEASYSEQAPSDFVISVPDLTLTDRARVLKKWPTQNTPDKISLF